MTDKLSDLGLSKADLQIVFAYLFRRITIRQFKDHFEDSLALKRKIDRNGYILLNCKVFAYAHYRAKQLNQRKPNPKLYGIHPDDCRLLRNLDLSHIPKKYSALTLDEFQESIATFLSSSSFDVLLGKFINKKMRFLIKSYGETKESLDMAMRLHALYNIYRVYPYFKSYLHMCNVGRGSASKCGHSIIKARTTKKAQRLLANSDGTFSSVHVPLDAVANQLASEETINPCSDLLDKLKSRASPRVKLFLSLMSGDFHPEFSMFIGMNNCKAALEMRYDSYQAQVQRYIGVTRSQVDNLFLKIRQL